LLDRDEPDQSTWMHGDTAARTISESRTPTWGEDDSSVTFLLGFIYDFENALG
jgi:hypothetical protein